MPDLDWSQCEAEESVPGKVSGTWVFKGTRMPVQTVFANLEAGMSVSEIIEIYDGLETAEIKAVIEFVVRSLDKEPAYAA